jgi:hypothetical protein
MSASHMIDILSWIDDPPQKVKDSIPDVLTDVHTFVPFADHPIKRLLNLIKPNMELGPWIAGGAGLRWYQGLTTDSSDIDVWFRNRIQFEQVFNTLTSYERHFALVCKTGNAVTLRFIIPIEDRTTDQPYPDHFDVQLISKQFFSSPEDIIDYFDFTICQVVTDGDQVMIGPRTHHDIKHKILRFNGDVNSTLAVRRFTKYLCRGYRPVDGMVAEMMAIPDLKLDFKDTDPYGF